MFLTTTEDLIPNTIRRRGARLRPYATIVGVDGSRQSVSFADLENCSNRASWFLESIPGEKVLYMGPNDIRYAIWLIAAIKTGKCILLPSLANRVSANQRFFETVGCKTLMYAPEAKSVLTPLIDAIQEVVECVTSPPYGEIMGKEVVPVYPFDKTFDEVKQDPFLGLHTSGTLGHPKPIYWNHVAVSSLTSSLDPSILDGHGSNVYREFVEGNDALLLFPLYHFGGMATLMATLYSDTTLVLPAPGTRLSPENCTLILQISQCVTMGAPPSLLESMLTYPPGMDVMARLKYVVAAGGPLNPIRGRALAERLPHLSNLIGSTEGGIYHVASAGDSSHWNSFKFFDVGQRMEEVTPGIFELVFPRSQLVNRTHAFFHTQPHLDLEFRTSDLFSPLDNGSESECGWWVYRGRADNWIATSNGLKVDPTETENTVASHPDVAGVLTAGSHRFRLCLLVELAQKEELGQEPEGLRYERALEKVWPIIEAANAKAPKFGRVPKELILFAAPDKPFLRAGKGTVQRRLTIEAYETEIDELYANVEEGLLIGSLTLPSSMVYRDLVPFLERLCTDTLLDDDGKDCTVSVDDNLFTLGLDSLSAFVLLARLKAALRKYGVDAREIQKVNNKLLYSATTIRQLASALAQMLSPQFNSSGNDEGRDRTPSRMPQLLEKYEDQVQGLLTGHAKEKGTKAELPSASEHVVILTGSTGSLGSYVLSSLLARPTVRKIFCLNRGSSLVSAQVSSFRARGLTDSPLHDEGRLEFLQVALSEPNFGLSDDEYAMLAREATHIIHNAYPVNFLLGLGAFAPQFDALLNLMSFAVNARHTPEILFVSSIAAAMRADGLEAAASAVIRERVLDRDVADRCLLEQGYGRSKYVCEQLLDLYVSSSGNAASVLRVGQVCGPVSGTGIHFWNAAEWVPSLVLSSSFIGAVPGSLRGGMDAVDWIPVDKLGEIVCDILGSSAEQHGEKAGGGQRLRVVNIVHPAPTTWSSLLPEVVRGVGAAAGNPVDVVSQSEWISRLEKSDHSPHLLRRNPAVKLIDFYRQTMLSETGAAGTEVRTDNMMQASDTARTLRQIDGSHMAKWMKGWRL
ncbi:hypothetical protein F5X98DRAFT_364957 [Xylaria grammica]|nr:hypothetical protein F5X98DRAFT_364957 [Xylaria grammica]